MSAILAGLPSFAADPLVVPRGTTAVLDGQCSEYADGVTETFVDAGGALGTVRLKHDGEWLWICATGAIGTARERDVAVFLDPQGDGGPLATRDDDALSGVIETGARSSARGDGAAGWTPRPGIDAEWSVRTATGRTGDTAEFALSIRGLQAGACGVALGLAVVHRGVNAPGDDHAWPAGGDAAVPDRWRRTYLDDAPCSCGGVFRTFADAEVRAGAPDAALGGAADMHVASGVEERQALAGFDVTAGVPQGATVVRAVLELPLSEATGTLPYGVEARRVDGPWTESTVTWSSRPPTGPAYASFTTSRRAGVLAIDVTNLVRGWVSRAIAEQAIALATPTAGASLTFETREASGALGPARLDVTCSPAVHDDPVDDAAADAAQAADLDRLRTTSEKPVRFVPGEFGGGVRFATFSIATPPSLGRDGETRARWFLAEHPALLRTPSPGDEWQLVRRSDDDRHLFFRLRHDGIPVFPAQLVVHLDERAVLGVSGRYVPGIVRDASPRVTSREAEVTALVGDDGVPRGLTRLVWLNRGLWGDADRTTHLAWAVELDADTVFVDAHTGAEIDRISKIQVATDRWILTSNNVGPFHLPPDMCFVPFWTLWFSKGQLESGATPDAEGWTARDSLEGAFWYYLWGLGHVSMDNFGGEIIMPIHVGTQQSWAGIGWPNAFYWWPCDTIEFSDFTPVNDVTTHEYTHGVTFSVAQLVYKNQSGALNESFSDVFAQLVDDGDWTIGEDAQGGPWRDMEDPGRFGQPVLASGYNDKIDMNGDGKPDDSGGVHRNSGIPNHVAYLVNHGGSLSGRLIQGIGPAKTRRLYYRALSWYLTPSSQFIDARDALVEAAAEFVEKKALSFTNQDVCSVRNAWAAAGYGSGDADCDGTADELETDTDGDGWPDGQDNCPYTANTVQSNHDSDPYGDACDNDDDNDGLLDAQDNCPLVSNKWQTDKYGGSPKGDACDDNDGDKVVDDKDNCVYLENPGQEDTDHDGKGDACDPDKDGDGLANGADNCPLAKNPGQEDSDADGHGDACDLCPGFADADNGDLDADGTGNPCDADMDGDGVDNTSDNCPQVKNAGQEDFDENGVGLACDAAEQEWFIHAAVGPLTVPVGFPSQPSPKSLPIPIGPADGPQALPAGFAVQVEVDLPVPYLAAIVASDGKTWAKTGPVEGPSTLSFAPPAFAGTLYQPQAAYAPQAAVAASFPSTLLVPPPDQLRFTLRVVPRDPVPPGTMGLSVRYSQGAVPEQVSSVAGDACDGAAGDGVVEPGEDARLDVGIGQQGTLAAPAASATLSTATPGVAVTHATASFPALAPNGGARSAAPGFAFSVGDDVACGTPIDFDMAIRSGAGSAVRRFTYVVGGTLQAGSADTPVAIPDGATATSSIAIGRAGEIADVDVTVWITHGNAGDLQLTLVAPDGTRVPLVLNAGAGADFAGTTFDDEASLPPERLLPPSPIRIRPVELLSLLDGRATQGTWTLEVADTARGVSGTLDRWSLSIELGRAACGTCRRALPGEPGGVHWTSPHALAWDAAAGATWYEVYEGAPADLPALLTDAPDACLRGRFDATATGEALFETPSARSMLWYLVRAANSAGAGPAGSGTAGPRRQDAKGGCP